MPPQSLAEITLLASQEGPEVWLGDGNMNRDQNGARVQLAQPCPSRGCQGQMLDFLGCQKGSTPFALAHIWPRWMAYGGICPSCPQAAPGHSSQLLTMR